MSRKFPPELEDFIRKVSWGKHLPELHKIVTAKFGDVLTQEQLKSFLARKHIIRFENHGKFEKGHIPANKGKKMPAAVYEKSKRTMFRKGHQPNNHREVGSERINVEGYVEIKVAEPNRWQLKHRVVYENYHNVKLKSTDVVIFLDGNKQNFDIENLALIDRGINAIMNHEGMRFADAEITRTEVNIARLKKAITVAKRKLKEVKNDQI